MNWVLFDYGEVLTRPPSTEVVAQIAAEFDVPVTRLWPAYWHGRERYDRGVVDAESYWRSVAEQLGTDAPHDEGLDLLVDLDQQAWLDVDPDMIALLEDLAGDTQLAMLSNAPLELAERVDGAPWAGLFRHRFFSSRLRLTKPDPRIFTQVCERLGTTPSEVLFVDDREVNVAAAVELGMRAVRFTGIGQLRADLRR